MIIIIIAPRRVSLKACYNVTIKEPPTLSKAKSKLLTGQIKERIRLENR